jgi:hypothetical protein
LKKDDESSRRKSEKSGRKSCSKWGMQVVFLYAQKPFNLPEAIKGSSPSFKRLLPTLNRF